MIWEKLKYPIQKVTAEVVNDVRNNIEFLQLEMINRGLTVDKLVGKSAWYGVQIADVVKILQGVENDIDVINETIAESIYYKDPNIIGNSFSAEEYHRWVLILNDMYDIIINDKGYYSTLILSDGNIAVDNSGAYFTIRGGKI